MTPELRAVWRARYCPHRRRAPTRPPLVERTADEMRAAGGEVTIRTVWMTLADRCPAAPDDQVLRAAAGLAYAALGLA